MEKIPSLSAKERIILDLLIANGEMYGLEMVAASEDLKRGTVYATLGRMADKGFVESELTTGNEFGPARRVYRVTGLGQAVYGAHAVAIHAFRRQFA